MFAPALTTGATAKFSVPGPSFPGQFRRSEGDARGDFRGVPPTNNSLQHGWGWGGWVVVEWSEWAVPSNKKNSHDCFSGVALDTSGDQFSMFSIDLHVLEADGV